MYKYNLSYLVVSCPAVRAAPMKDRHKGTINLVNPGCVQYAQVLETYKSEVDSSIEYKVIDEDDESEFARKLRSSRSNCYLSTGLLRELAPIYKCLNNRVVGINPCKILVTVIANCNRIYVCWNPTNVKFNFLFKEVDECCLYI